MSPNKLEIHRKVHSIGDLLNEIGGFSGAIEYIFIVLVPLVNYWSLDKYLI